MSFLTLRRFIQQSAFRSRPQPGGNESGSDITKSAKAPTQSPQKPSSSIQKFVPTTLDKIFLVWSGHYKSRDQIPNVVEKEVLERTRSWARIRINLGFMVFAACGCFLMVYSGKQAAKRGDTLESRNIAWHKKINEEHQREMAKKDTTT